MEVGSNELKFNNGMIEIYDNNYTKMKFHSDQCLDLVEDSFICLFSCYENLLEKSNRKLTIKEKSTGICSDIQLDNNSVVIFSTSTNKNYLHKITASPSALPSNENKWLGITLRLSKTFVKFINEIPYFQTGVELTLATENEKKDFF